jgi:hypothetical protein
MVTGCQFNSDRLGCRSRPEAAISEEDSGFAFAESARAGSGAKHYSTFWELSYVFCACSPKSFPTL